MYQYSIVSGLVFGLIALLQLFRAISQWPVQIAEYNIPVLASWIIAIVAGGLCAWAFYSVKKLTGR